VPWRVRRKELLGLSKEHQEHIDFHRNYCVHYQPREPQCGAGVSDKERPRVPVGVKGIKWGPCIEGHLLGDPLAVCPHWERPSLEAAEKYADAVEKSMRNMLVVEPFIGRWRKRLPIGKDETVECPVCQGKLHLSQAASNGHVRASCETEDCVRFME